MISSGISHRTRKKAIPEKDGFYIFDAENGRLQRVDVKLNAAFQVGGFILVDHIRFGEFVQHGGHLRKQRYGGILLSRIAQRLYSIRAVL